MAKKKVVKNKRVKHESFKITPPKPTYERIFFYMVTATLIGFSLGLFFGNQLMTALATYAPAS